MGMAYLLLKHDHVYKKLSDEIHSAFKNVDDITLNSVAQLPYLNACINETFRFYSPACNGLPRIVPKGGGYILGEYIPANVRSRLQGPGGYSPFYIAR